MTDAVRIESVAFNHQLPKWATEDTLKRIEELLELNAFYAKTTGSSGKEQTSVLKETSSTMKKTTVAIKKNSGYLKKLTSGFNKRFFHGVTAGGFMVGLEKAVKGTTQQFIDLVGSSSGLAKYFGVVGIAAFGLYKTLESVVARFQYLNDEYTRLLDTGISLNGDFMNLLTISAEYGTSISETVEYVTQFSDVITTLRSSSGGAVKSFMELNYQLRDSLMQFGQFGLTAADVNDFLGEYLDTQTQYGQIEINDKMRLVRWTRDYIKEIVLLSKVTGRRRMELLREIESQKRESIWNIFVSNMQADTRRMMNKVLANFTGILGPDIADVFQEIAQFGYTSSEFGQRLSAMFPELVSGMRQLSLGIQNGTMTYDEVSKVVGNIIRRTQEQSNTILNNNSTFMAISAKNNGAMKQILDDMIRWRRLNLDRKRMDEYNQLTILFNNLRHIIRRGLAPAMQTFANTIKDAVNNGAIQKMVKFINDTLILFGDGVKKFFDITRDDGIVEAIARSFRYLFSSNKFINMIGRFLGKVFNAILYYQTGGWLGSVPENEVKPKKDDNSEIIKNQIIDNNKKENINNNDNIEDRLKSPGLKQLYDANQKVLEEISKESKKQTLYLKKILNSSGL